MRFASIHAPVKAARLLCALLPLAAVFLASCAGDYNFTLMGYRTRPNYDMSIKTVRVPIFGNTTFRRGLEFDLTKAVVTQIEARTPYKVVSPDCNADTELSGTIVSFNKNLLNRTQQNEVREAETVLGVQIVWKDLRSGEILSRPKPGSPGTPPLPPPGAPPLPPPPPLLIQSLGHFIEEIGQTLTTAEQENVNQLAVQIVSAMEAPW